MSTKKLFLSVLTLAFLTGCGPTTSEPVGPTSAPTDPTVSEPTTSEPTTNTTSDPSSVTTAPVEWVDLATAIKNTSPLYELHTIGIGSSEVIEGYSGDMYFHIFQGFGMLIPDEDKKFTYPFFIKNSYENDEHITHMEVRGRLGDASYIKNFSSKNFFSYMTEDWINQFVQISDDTYTLEGTNFGFYVKDFFQSNIVKYATDFDLVVSEDGYLKYLFCYERDSSNEKVVVAKYGFNPIKSKEDFKIYKQWVKDGKQINLNIADYKNLYQPSRFSDPVSTYEDTEVTFEGTVTTSDVDGNLYVANYDEMNGFVGIKIKGHGDQYKKGQTVKVTGKVKTKSFEFYIDEADITELSKESEVFPVYDEEAVSTVYGGGIYAANLFMQNPPLYASSIYTTYAYVKSYEAQSASADTKIEIIFPSQQISETDYLTVDVIVPHELSSEVKESIYDAISSVGKYDTLLAAELEFGNILIRFDSTKETFMSFEFTNDSYVSKRLTAKQKIETKYGFENFPMPANVESTAYTFGVFNTVNIEMLFGLDESNPISGLYCKFTGDTLSSEHFKSYVNSLIDYGFSVVDEIMDIQGKRHVLLKYEPNIYISISSFNDGYSSPYYEMWVYKNDEPIIPTPIEERLHSVTKDFFDIDSFTRMTGSFDADYNVFQIKNYAGIKFEEEPLVLYTVNVDSPSKLTDYARQLIQEKGYKQYKINNIPYTYTTRGQAHTVLRNSDGVFADLACYSTTDYTFWGHDEFVYRIEVLLYTGEEPLKVKTYSDLSVLSSIYAQIDSKLDYNSLVDLPEGTKVEFWGQYDGWTVEYGYGACDEIFIYTSDLDGVFKDIRDALVEVGFDIGIDRDTRATFSKSTTAGNIFMGIMKEKEKGYIRVLNNVLGVSFTQ